MKNNKNVRKDNLSPVENGSKRIYKMYKSKKNWVVAPVVLLTLLGAVAPAPIALTNVVNAEGETPATTTSSSEATTTDSGATTEKDNTVAPVEATIAAKKDAIFAIQNLELPKSLTAAEKEKTHAKNVKFKTQDDFIASINAIADSAETQSVFDVLKSAYTQAAVAAYETFEPKVTSTKEKLAAVNGLEDKVSTDADAQTYLEYFNGKADATQTTVNKALDKFVDDLAVNAGKFDRTLGTETKPAENNYQTVRATLDKVLAEQTSALTSIYNAAVEQGKINTDYNAKKADAAKRINELPNLTAAERNQYLADINKVAADNDDTRTNDSLTTIRDWKTELETIVKNATKTNNQHVTTLITTVTDYLDGKAKDSLNNTIPVYLTEKAVTDYKSKVNSFAELTEVRGIDTNLNKVSDLQTLFDTIKKANEDATVSYKLNSLKQQYIAAINNKDDADYALLSEPTRQAYVHRISDSAVTTSAQVRDIFAEYKDELEVAKLLHDNATLDALKNAGYDKVKGLSNIDDLVKGNYQFAIKSASTKDEVVSIFKEALAANRAALRAAQDAAIKDINALPYLTDAEKKDYATEITLDFNADGTIRDITLDDVAATRAEAISQNAAAELKAAKYDAKKTVQGLKYLENGSYESSSEKAELKLYDKDHPENVAKTVADFLVLIERAETVDSVSEVVAKAVKDNFKFGVKNALTVKEAQEIATEAINTLDALTAAEKADALKDVADAKTKEDVLKAYEAADSTNAANIEAAKRASQLAKEKEDAIKAINAFKYLTSDQKADYVAKVKAAANSDDVKDVLGKASNDDKIGFEAFKQLEAAKTNAVKLIRGDYDKGETAGYETSAYKSDITTFGSLVYLTNEQKADYVAKILAAKSIAEVDKLVDDAYYTNLNQITKRSEFDTVASELINKSKYLNPSQKAGYVSNLKAAKDIDAAKKVLKEAVDKGYEQNDKLVMKEIDSLLSSGLYNTAKTKLAALRLDSNISTYTAKVQGLLDLREAKEKAVNEITGADYVSDKDKENLINSVNKSTSVADVNKVLDQLKDLQPATVVQLYRAYNPNSGEHLYTADKAEYDKLVGLGWHGEGNAWKAASKGAPVYRLYNPNSGEHFYTISESEYNDVAKAGWKKEGVAFYSDANRGVEVFRLFNPNAKGAGSHHYTTLASERDDLIKAGWKYENVAFYGLK